MMCGGPGYGFCDGSGNPGGGGGDGIECGIIRGIGVTCLDNLCCSQYGTWVLNVA
jgi:hypothetical protein